MQDIKTEIKTKILTGMITAGMTSAQEEKLNSVITDVLFGYDIARSETEVATQDDTNEQLLKMFLATKGRRLSRKTVRAYMHTLGRAADIIHKPFTQFVPLDVEYFLHTIRKTNTEVSCNNHLRNLHAFFAWAVKQRLIMYSPCDQIETYKEVKKPIEVLSVEELDRLRSACVRPRDRALLEFLRCTALRAEELISVNVRDIDFQKGKLIVYGQKTKTYRLVGLDDITLGYIRAYLRERGVSELSEEPLFVSTRGGKRLLESGVNNCLHKIGKRSGIGKRIYVHLFRRTTATTIVKRGGSIEEAGLYLGHKPTNVTGMHYVYRGEDYSMNIFEKYVAAV